MLSQYVDLPASLLGLLLLFMTLICLGRIPKSLEYVSQFCLRHSSLFFIPAWVAAWFYAEELADNLWLFLFAILFSNFVSLCITSWLGQRFLGSRISQSG
ncbi:MAG: holin-like protein [Paraglaciecola sp.]